MCVRSRMFCASYQWNVWRPPSATLGMSAIDHAGAAHAAHTRRPMPVKRPGTAMPPPSTPSWISRRTEGSW
jgi:hypothetical protein